MAFRSVLRRIAWSLPILLLIVGIAFAFSWGSDSETPDVRADQGEAPDEGTDESSNGSNRFEGTFDEVLYEVGQVHPRFAGFWIDESAETTTVLLEGNGDDAVADAVVELLTVAFDDRTFLKRRVVARTDAEYSFVELFEWFRSVRSEVGSVPGMVLSGIDERRNRIKFGVEDVSVDDEIDKILQDHGVPTDAVIIEERAPIQQHPK